MIIYVLHLECGEEEQASCILLLWEISHGRIIVLAEGLCVFGLSEMHQDFCFTIYLFLVAYNQSVELLMVVFYCGVIF